MKAVLQNLMSVLGGEAAVRLANFAGVLLIARAYGGSVLGAYALSLAVVTVVVMFADCGLQTAAITQLSASIPDRDYMIGRLTAVKTVMLGIATFLLAAIAAWAREADVVWGIGFWLVLRAVFQSYSQLQMAILKAVFRANCIVFIQLAHSCLVFLGIACAVRWGWGIFALLGWLTFCQFVELALGAQVLYQNGIRPHWPERFRIRMTLQMAGPYGIAYGLANLIVRIDTIVLSGLTSLAGVGAFSAANTILLMVYVSSWLLSSILLPQMVHLKENKLTGYANLWARCVLLLAVPSAILVSLVAPRVMVLLYGPAYASSGLIGSAMALACPFIVLNSIYTARAIAADRRSLLVGVYGATALATLILDFILGRTFGALGIAAAIVVREAGMLLAFSLLLSRRVPLAADMASAAPSQGSRASLTDATRSHDCL
jgi:O-antigen/teichoic acid export membrane protein